MEVLQICDASALSPCHPCATLVPPLCHPCAISSSTRAKRGSSDSGRHPAGQEPRSGRSPGLCFGAADAPLAQQLGDSRGAPASAPCPLPQVFTRYGKCYTFNSGQDGKPRLISMKGGTGNGLEIMLDIQQDEYLPVWGETGNPRPQLLHAVTSSSLGAPQPLPSSPLQGSTSLRLPPLPSFHFSSLRVLFFPFPPCLCCSPWQLPTASDKQPSLVYK